MCGIVSIEKDGDAAQALETIKTEFSTVGNFDLDFPSLCFAIVTGVGKTRLMGSFISYLYLSEGIRHFFVLAPNLTIYNKLIADFTPNTPKYVFQGISEFAVNPPEIITGDNYESRRGIRNGWLFNMGEVHINIFNAPDERWRMIFTGLGNVLFEVFAANPCRKGIPPGVKATLY